MFSRSSMVTFIERNTTSLSDSISSPSLHSSVSHFYIGKCKIDSVGLSIYRYCRLAPYLAGVHTGLYKRIRWNVERPRESLQQETDGEMEGHPEEDKPVAGNARATTTE